MINKSLLRLLFIIAPLIIQATPPMSLIEHPVSTQDPAVQEYFNQGLTYIFAFNHDLAFQFFEKAVQRDPELAMGYWGMALALGQNINKDVTSENEIKCYNYGQTALKLSSKATANEQAYIKALVTRYTNDPKADLIPLRFAYREAMKKVTVAYPEDLDASSLYAESILDLNPWKYWSPDGKPYEGTMEAIDVLSAVLRRNPDHIGANHYIIHAWEASPTPERALLSADRLTTMLPESGHLLHMPCHIFVLVGNYEEAIKTSKNAIAADQDYIKKNGLEGYALHYLSHNMYVLARAYMLMEDYENAIQTALSLNEFLTNHWDGMAKFSLVPLETYMYFHRWKELLAYQLPTNNSPYATTYWHFSRAIAYAHLGDLKAAEKEQKLMEKARQTITTEMIANNPAKTVAGLAALVLQATLAQQPDEQIALLTKAILIQDNLDYDEPPAWYSPLRLSLGKVLLQQKRFTEAVPVFTSALQQLQRNGRLLMGLTLALKGQNLTWDAFWTEREAKAALTRAPHPLTLDDL